MAEKKNEFYFGKAGFEVPLTYLAVSDKNYMKWKSGPCSSVGSGGTDLAVYQEGVIRTVRVVWPANPVVNKLIMYQDELVTVKFKIIIHFYFVGFHFPLFHILVNGENNSTFVGY